MTTHTITSTFEQAYDKYYMPLYRYVLSKVRHTEDAEDIVQELFTRLYPRFEKLDQSQLSSYLYRIAVNILRDRYRRERLRTVVNIDDCPSLYSPDELESVEHKDEAKYLLVHLPEKRRATFYLLDRGYSFQEIATLFNMKYGTVKTNASRDTRKLARIRHSSV